MRYWTTDIQRSRLQTAAIRFSCLAAILCASLSLLEECLNKRMLEQLSSRGRWLDCPSGQIFYKEAGTNPGLVFFLESGAGGTALELWNLAAPLAQFGTVIAYDRAGHGRSQRDRLGVTGAAIAADAKCLLTARAKNASIVAIGYSLGGKTVLDLHRRNPELISALVLLDPSFKHVSKRLGSKDSFVQKVKDATSPTRMALRASFAIPRLRFYLEKMLDSTVDPEHEILTSRKHILMSENLMRNEWPGIIDAIDSNSSLGTLPLLVLSTVENEYVAPIAAEESGENWDTLAALSKVGRHQILEGVSHTNIQNAACSDVIASAILKHLHQTMRL